MRRLSNDQARRIALSAQGLGRARPERPITARDVRATIARVAQFQVDSVNVVSRAHYLPLFSRLGGYDTTLLDRAGARAPRRVVEYWGHAACLVDIDALPGLQFRMANNAERGGNWMGQVEEQHPGLLDHVLAEVAQRGPLTARQIEHAEERDRGNWGWNWSAVKQCLEHAFSAGRLAIAGRNTQFERLYDLPERVLPQPLPPLDVDEQHLLLVTRAARALGVFSVNCVATYFYLKTAPTKVAVDALERAGLVERVEVAGWAAPTWRWAADPVPRRSVGRALLSPFDSMMFSRDRIEQLFDYRYRIEIYVPAEQRLHGYYVYSFVLDSEFVARVDLKADRASGRLLVQSTWFEDGVASDRARVAVELAAELRELARWLGLTEIEVVPRGDACTELAAVIG